MLHLATWTLKFNIIGVDRKVVSQWFRKYKLKSCQDNGTTRNSPQSLKTGILLQQWHRRNTMNITMTNFVQRLFLSMPISRLWGLFCGHSFKTRLITFHTPGWSSDYFLKVSTYSGKQTRFKSCCVGSSRLSCTRVSSRMSCSSRPTPTQFREEVKRITTVHRITYSRTHRVRHADIVSGYACKPGQCSRIAIVAQSDLLYRNALPFCPAYIWLLRIMNYKYDKWLWPQTSKI